MLRKCILAAYKNLLQQLPHSAWFAVGSPSRIEYLVKLHFDAITVIFAVGFLFTCSLLLMRQVILENIYTKWHPLNFTISISVMFCNTNNCVAYFKAIKANSKIVRKYILNQVNFFHSNKGFKISDLVMK